MGRKEERKNCKERKETTFLCGHFKQIPEESPPHTHKRKEGSISKRSIGDVKLIQIPSLAVMDAT